MGYTLFQRREPDDAPASEFAATVASMPPGGDDALPLAADTVPPGPDSLPSGIDSGIPDVVTDFGAESLPAPADAAVEQRPTTSHIGRYALKGLLGEGGLGQVHEAWDPLLSRTVAVKTLQFETDNPTRLSLDRLFLNEARAAAGLSHPHIVTVHDAGLSAHGVYIAMERLHGSDLRFKLAAGWRPTPAQAAQLVRRVADALAYAHARGVVHCDIKPANIFLNRRLKPKVLDFGIARITHHAVLPTPDGVVAGSPHYLAPEQLLGGEVDARTDIHALGVVFYELLTGRKAFAGDTLEQITNAVLNNHPAPAHELRSEVSPTLSAIAGKAMARDPAARYATAADMATELRRWIARHAAAEAADATPATPLVAAPARRVEPGRRPRTLLLGAGLLACALALVVWARSPEREPVPAALSPTPTATPTVAATTPTAPMPTAASPVATQAPTTGGDTATAADAGPAAIAPSPTPAAATEGAARPGAKPVRTTPPARPRAGSGSASRDARPVAAAALATGSLRLAISPWGTVEIDGTPAGTAPPLTQLSLPEGRHTVTVRNSDFPAYTTTVQVSADAPVTVRHRFAP